MALNKQQLEDKEKWMRYFFIWERDLLEAARRWSAWRSLAHSLGFTDKKIDTPWTFPDAGRQIKYAENPFWARKQLTNSAN